LKVDEEEISSQLKGNTLRVYWELLKSSDDMVGVREIQRSLGFSNPSLASYHLNKLEKLDLVEKKHGDYYLTKKVRVGVLKQFTKVGGFMLPRYVLYATMFTSLLFFYITQLKKINFYSIFALIFGVSSTVILWYETLRTWRQKP
jgi:hypothetical protein